jgi:hypothetical protein
MRIFETFNEDLFIFLITRAFALFSVSYSLMFAIQCALNKAWEIVREDIKISSKESLDNY